MRNHQQQLEYAIQAERTHKVSLVCDTMHVKMEFRIWRASPYCSYLKKKWGFALHMQKSIQPAGGKVCSPMASALHGACASCRHQSLCAVQCVSQGSTA